MPIDEQQVDSIAVNLLTPLIARLIGWASSVLLGGAGISLTVPGDAATKISLVIVGLCGVAYHAFMASRSNTKIAQAGFVQGAAAAGVTVLPSEVPKVVSTNAAVPIVPPANTLNPTTDAQGNITITPLTDKTDK